MKKLMTVLASAALAFGLYADDAAKDGTSFEVEEPGVVEGEEGAPATFAPEEGPWDISALSDPLEIGAYDGEELPYATSGANVRWDDKFPKTKKNERFLTLDTGTEKLTRAMGNGNLVIDQIVKFSGFDEVQTNFADGTKIAVWMSDIEVEGQPNETNLYVTAGKVTDGAAEPTAIKIAGTWELQKWYRLTIKSIGNIYQDGYTDDERAGFVVYVNGTKVGDEAAQALVQVPGKLNTAAKKLYDDGLLFPSIAKDTTFTSVAYAGTGAIDDIVADAKGPEFAIDNVDVTVAPIDGAIIKVFDAEGNEITLEGGKYSVPNGDFTVEYTADEGWILRENPTIKNHNTDDPNVDDSATVVPEEGVALIGETYYASLAETLLAVKELEKTQDEIEVTIVKTIEGEEIPEVGTFGFPANDIIVIEKGGNWTVFGDALYIADIGNEKSVTVLPHEGLEDGALTFSGTVNAGATLVAATIDTDDVEIALAATASIVTKTDLSEVINVPQGYTLKPTPGTGDYEGYTIYTAVEAVKGTVLLITDAGATTNDYQTLALALAAAQSGDIVMPTATIAELQTTITVNEGVTLDLNNQIVNVDFHQTKLSNSGKIVIYNNSLALVNNWYIGGNFEAGEALTDGSNFLFPKGTQMDVAKQTAVQTAITITGDIQWGLPIESNKLVTVVGTATINAKIYPTATLTVPNAITPTLTTIEGFEVKSTVGAAMTTWAAEEKQGGDIPTDPEKDITDDTKPADIGLDPAGPFKDAKKDELIKLSKWANKAGVKAADINAGMTFGEGGAPMTEMADAYLLDCTPAQLTDAKKAFKFNADDLAAAMAGTVNPETFADKTYNGKIVIKAFSDVACETPAEDEAAAKFYKAFLVK